jgi:iron(III) transport system substrate-binding protein
MKAHARGRVLVLVVVAALVALAATAVEASGSRQASPAPKPPSAATWRALIGKAQAEGSVTIYSVQDPTDLAALASQFQQKFKIKVNVVRNVDNVLVSLIDAEESTGKAIADIWVGSQKRYALGAMKNGWVVDPMGPNFFKSRYDRTKLTFGKAWIAGSAILGMAWNTAAFPGPVQDVTTFLRPEFKGKIGVPDPRVSTSFMDWYLFQQKKYGADILDKLAAQNPKIYISSLPMTQAVASGEIIGAPLAAGTALVLKGQGAPIDYKVLPDNWNAPYIGLVLKQAPHPNAAQLLADYMLSPEGQGLVDKGFGAVYPNIPGTFYAQPRIVNVNDFTPAKVKAFTDHWVALFTK